VIKRRIKNRGGIPAKEIANAYIKQFKVSFWDRLFGRTSLQLADANYEEANPIIIEAILFEDKTDKEEYIAEIFDCDDFTYALMGVFHQRPEAVAMPIFITWVAIGIIGRLGKIKFIAKSIINRMTFGIFGEVEGHALLSYYYEGHIFMVEPQTDEVFKPPEDWRLILLCG